MKISLVHLLGTLTETGSASEDPGHTKSLVESPMEVKKFLMVVGKTIFVLSELGN